MEYLHNHKFDLLRIMTRRVVDNIFAGDYFSLYKGRGTEFLEVREYSPGDDEVREIDWNVTARTGRPHVKKFREERDLVVMILADMSASMNYGSGAEIKTDKIMEAAAIITMSVLKRNNRVGLITFTDRVESFIPPRGGRKQLYRILSTLSDRKSAGKGTDLAEALKFANRLPGKGTMLFLISDFMSEGFEKAFRSASIKFDLIPVMVGDQAEDKIPDVGIVEFTDSETGETVLVDTSSRSFIGEHNKKVAARKHNMKELFTTAGIDSVRLDAGRPVFPPLMEFFRKRVRSKVRRK